MSVSLDVSFSDRKNLVSNLLKILKGIDFCGQEPSVYPRLENLLKRLRNDVWFVLESPYVDRHYRDTYYSYYSSKFKKIGRDCIRVHIFNGEISKDDLLDKGTNFEKKNIEGFLLSVRYCGIFWAGR